MKDVLRSLIGRNVHIHTTRSNESLFGELREVSERIAILTYGEHTYYISLEHIVWFQEWPAEPGSMPRSEFH